MNLTPEERAIGKENFHAAIGSEHTRRDFLKQGLMAGVVSGGGLGAFYFGYGKAVGDPVRVGVIGTGDEGSVLIGAINPEFLQVKAIADIRPYNVHRAFHGDHYSETALKARCGLMTKYGWATEETARKNVKVYGAYQELIEHAKEDGLEAVIIALPLHLHAPAAIAAMTAGLHVLTEKLMGHSVMECKEMARAAKQTGLHLATGHQRHYNILYDNAVDQIRRGLLGDLHYIRAQWHRGNMPGTDSWQQPMPEGIKPKDKQAKKLAAELESWQRKLAGLRVPSEVERIHDDPVARFEGTDDLGCAVKQMLARRQQVAAVDPGAVAHHHQIVFAGALKCSQCIRQCIIQLLFGISLTSRVESGLADESCGDNFHQSFLKLQQTTARQGEHSPQLDIAVALGQFRDYRLV